MITPLHVASPPAETKILFVGNSLLNFNNVPETVARMVESTAPGRKATYTARFVGHLEDIPAGSDLEREITGGNYDVVVLQGAMVSSSHKFRYPQDRGIALAKQARIRGSRVLLYVEWARRGIDETEYTLNIYRQIAQASGAEIVPVGNVWDAVRRKAPGTELWQPDGNHSTEAGSFVAAATVCAWLEPTAPRFIPRSVPAAFAKLTIDLARRARQEWPSPVRK